MFVYAIQNKYTKLYLENGKSHARTKAKFDEKPRLFHRKEDATNCMKCWVLGVWHVEIYDGEANGPVPPDKKPTDRKLEDLEVVKFRLQEF